ncbi:hypothetical protein P691DRAFT_301375 [Macrolepiota fuliginosa MF-IS2]|uniref:Uncharacterized protein n=1 Tax=Macrolepiota fuliginosa MF-IS2 TaxID=1400762 RepID=A0A9P6C4Z4_9AGAR|nr:hypothetical protein P691DRAFT_301375 [Macrolepiota fuliginosa MF-IS2]
MWRMRTNYVRLDPHRLSGHSARRSRHQYPAHTTLRPLNYHSEDIRSKNVPASNAPPLPSSSTVYTDPHPLPSFLSISRILHNLYSVSNITPHFLTIWTV